MAAPSSVDCKATEKQRRKTEKQRRKAAEARAAAATTSDSGSAVFSPQAISTKEDLHERTMGDDLHKRTIVSPACCCHAPAWLIILLAWTSHLVHTWISHIHTCFARGTKPSE
jgi:hypothetical protein